MITIILAGGINTRMKMDYPKVILEVRKMPMIVRAINNAILLNSEMIMVVLSKKYEKKIKEVINKYIKNRNIFYVIQNQAYGTAHALHCCVPYLEELDPFKKILVLNANQPLLSFYTLDTFINWDNDNNSRILCCRLDNPNGFDRLIRDKYYNFVKLEKQKNTNFVSSGVYMFTNIEIQENIKKVPRRSDEFMLMDFVNLLNPAIYMLENKFQKEFYQVNNRLDVKKIENLYVNKK